MLFKKAYTLYDSLQHFLTSTYDEKNFLFFFRVTVSLVAIIDLSSIFADLHLFFAPAGSLMPQELMYLQTEYFKYLHPLYTFLSKNHLTTYFFSGSVYVYALSLILLLIGLFTRAAAFTSLILQLIIFKSFSNFNYGFDHFMTMSLFYCLVFPTGKYYSVDSKIFKFNQTIQINYRSVLQIHLAIAYLFSGIAKALDEGWWNGFSVWKALASVDGDIPYISPVLLAIAGIIVVLMELSYPILVFNTRARKYILAGIIGMHAGIGISMGLYSFSTIMIVWNIAAFGNISTKPKKSNESIVT